MTWHLSMHQERKHGMFWELSHSNSRPNDLTDHLVACFSRGRLYNYQFAFFTRSMRSRSTLNLLLNIRRLSAPTIPQWNGYYYFLHGFSQAPQHLFGTGFSPTRRSSCQHPRYRVGNPNVAPEPTLSQLHSLINRLSPFPNYIKFLDSRIFRL